MVRMVYKLASAAPRVGGAAALALLALASLVFVRVVDAVARSGEATPRVASLEPYEVSKPSAAPSLSTSPLSVLPLPGGNTGFRYAIGDRLKVTFYEQLVSEGDGAGRAKARSMLERTELSGEYVVQLSGEAFLPIIGAVAVAQRTPSEVEATLIKRANAAVGDTLKVSVVVTEREPVYIMGALPKTGVFKYSPGMVVAQVVSLAGGDAAGGENWQQIDVAREQERLRKSLERLKRHLAVIDVLTAESREVVPKPSSRLIELAGLGGAAELVEAARETRQLERARQNLQIAALEKLVAATTDDLAALRDRRDQVAAIVNERAKRRDELAARVTRGVTPENLMVQARNELVAIQASWHEVRSAVAHSEIRILELERDRDQARLAAQIDLEQQLRTSRQAVAEEEVMMSTIGQLLLKLGPTLASSRGGRDQTYRLVRRTPNGTTQLAAEMLTPLEPGDVVQVLARRHDPATADSP